MNKKERKYWTDEDWDNSSYIRLKFKEITGITLDDTMQYFLIIVAIVTVLASIFFN